MSNREKFKETFGQIEMSEEKLGEIESLELQHKKTSYMKPAAAFAVVFVLVLLTGKFVWDDSIKDYSNKVVSGKIIYYAAEKEDDEYITQEENITLEEEERFRLKKEHVMVNNDILSEEVLDTYIHENGLTYYKIADGSEWGLKIEAPKHTSIFVYKIKYEEGGTKEGIVAFRGRVKEVDGRIYLSFNVSEKGQDITEDFADGIATGMIGWSSGNLADRLEEKFEYRVEGTLEDYTVDVWWVESEE